MQAEIVLAIPVDHPAFAGHFPGMPILPGVVLLDAAVYGLEQAARDGDYVPPPGPALHCRITSAKFLSPVAPGETLVLRYQTPASGNTRFAISGNGRHVAEGVIAFSPTP
ncbi:MAG: Beta-hydroxyacyl-(acyl-carrier-protein) dehydratase, FabA/FabZ [Polaromonas sp.]|nr:Beta-hydroxyacyl-(acyl-carrier-protein) dehydratase, FabA/FabZ [Polaromonas sp.]